MPRIPVWVQFLVQILGVAGQVYLVSDFIQNVQIIHFCQVTISFLQTVVGIWGHYSNPDGTKPEAAYTPKRKLLCIFLTLSLFIPVASGFAANGDEFGTSFRGEYGFKLLDGQSLTVDGVWVSIGNVKSATICQSGIESGASITVQALNDTTTPANATDGFIVATLTSASAICTSISSSLPVRFMKAEKVQGGTPAASTILFWGLSR